MGNIKKLQFYNRYVTKTLCGDELVKEICHAFPQLETLYLPRENAIEGNTLHLLPKSLTSLQMLCGGIPSHKLQHLMQLQSLTNLDLTFNKPKVLFHFSSEAEEDDPVKIQVMDEEEAEEVNSSQDSLEFANTFDQKPPPLKLKSLIFSGIVPMSILHQCDLRVDPTSLETFQFIRAPVDESLPSFLMQCNNLRHLTLCAKDLVNGGLFQLPLSIESLDISESVVTEHIFKQLYSLEKLRSLNLKRCKGVPDATQWISLLPKSLEALNASCVIHSLNNDFCANLEKLSNLKYLKLRACKNWIPTNEDISSLPKTLRNLALAGCTFSRASLEGFKNLRNLEHLDLRSSHLEQEDLNILPEFLTGLSLNRNITWTEKALHYIAHFHKLKKLMISIEGKITLTYLRSLPSTLEMLSIVADEFSPEAIEYISSLSNLKEYRCYPRKSIPEKFGFNIKRW